MNSCWLGPEPRMPFYGEDDHSVTLQPIQLTSGVIGGGVQHCLVAGWVQVGNQTAAPLEDGNISFAGLGCDMW